MSHAANIRIAIQNEQTSALSDSELAELCDTTITNVRMVRLRLKKGTKEDRLKRLESIVAKMQDAIRTLEMRNTL